MIILGIDPGTVRVGYGLIRKEKRRLVYVAGGLLTVKSPDTNGRLLEIAASLKKLIVRHKPEMLVLEKLYFMKNKKTAIEVAQARGVILLQAATLGLTIREIAPSTVKSAVAGYGLASKQAVARMVCYFLNTDLTAEIDDATDALAIAIAGSNLMPKLLPN